MKSSTKQGYESSSHLKYNRKNRLNQVLPVTVDKETKEKGQISGPSVAISHSSREHTHGGRNTENIEPGQSQKYKRYSRAAINQTFLPNDPIHWRIKGRKPALIGDLGLQLALPLEQPVSQISNESSGDKDNEPPANFLWVALLGCFVFLIFCLKSYVSSGLMSVYLLEVIINLLLLVTPLIWAASSDHVIEYFDRRLSNCFFNQHSTQHSTVSVQ